MSDSLQKAFFGVIALSLSVIAIQLIPFAKHRELQNLCLEFEVIYMWDDYDSKRLMKKQKLISKKAGLKNAQYVDDEVEEFCDLLNTNSNSK